jgi:hypothetical protein
MLPLPPKPVFTPSAPYYIAAAQLYNALRDLGAQNPLAIAAIVNGDMESAFHASANGDDRTAFNVWQHHWNPRGQRILDNTGIDLRTETSFKRIAEALWWELNNVAAYAKAFAEMKADKTAGDATRIFCVAIEGAGAKDAADRRVEDSRFWVNFIATHGAFIAANPAV